MKNEELEQAIISLQSAVIQLQRIVMDLNYEVVKLKGKADNPDDAKVLKVGGKEYLYLKN